MAGYAQDTTEWSIRTEDENGILWQTVTKGMGKMGIIVTVGSTCQRCGSKQATDVEIYDGLNQTDLEEIKRSLNIKGDPEGDPHVLCAPCAEELEKVRQDAKNYRVHAITKFWSGYNG